jgi:hypothetical protein
LFTNSFLTTTPTQDKFGGLKKFLEKYEQDFFVSNDHPFNPHVYLRGDVSEEQIKLLLSGQPVATPVVAPSRRSKKAARRKNNMQLGTSAKDSNRSPHEHSGTVNKEPAQSRFVGLFQPSDIGDMEFISPSNPNAAVFVPRGSL